MTDLPPVMTAAELDDAIERAGWCTLNVGELWRLAELIRHLAGAHSRHEQEWLLKRVRPATAE